MPDIPVLDITTLLDGHGGDGLIDELDRAARDFGFFQIVGHGVPPELIESVWRQTSAFSQWTGRPS